jgi:hypothetical protein
MKIRAIVQYTEKLIVDEPLSESTDIGPLATHFVLYEIKSCTFKEVI